MPNRQPTQSVSSDVQDVLQACRVSGNKIYLPGYQLERRVYEDTNKVFAAFGGKWNRSCQAILFASEAEAAECLKAKNGSYFDRKKSRQLFETPEPMAETLADWVSVNDCLTALEPSAGTGRLVSALSQHAPGTSITAVEIDALCCKQLRELAKADPACDLQVHEQDFLTVLPESLGRFDCVIMNPPFSGQAYIEHIFHAWQFVKSGGCLGAIVPTSWEFGSDRKTIAFRQFMAIYVGADYITQPHGSFSESGTQIATTMLCAQKPAKGLAPLPSLREPGQLCLV